MKVTLQVDKVNLTFELPESIDFEENVKKLVKLTQAFNAPIVEEVKEPEYDYGDCYIDIIDIDESSDDKSEAIKELMHAYPGIPEWEAKYIVKDILKDNMFYIRDIRNYSPELTFKRLYNSKCFHLAKKGRPDCGVGVSEPTGDGE